MYADWQNWCWSTTAVTPPGGGRGDTPSWLSRSLLDSFESRSCWWPQPGHRYSSTYSATCRASITLTSTLRGQKTPFQQQLHIFKHLTFTMFTVFWNISLIISLALKITLWYLNPTEQQALSPNHKNTCPCSWSILLYVCKRKDGPRTIWTGRSCVVQHFSSGVNFKRALSPHLHTTHKPTPVWCGGPHTRSINQVCSLVQFRFPTNQLALLHFQELSSPVCSWIYIDM